VFIGLPGTGGALFLPSIYVTWFPSPTFMVEPQVLFQYSSVEDDVTLMGALQLGYRFAISRTGSFYPAVNVGWLTIANGGESATLGGGFGLRWEVCTKLGLRTELVYRRWMCDGCELNEVILSFGGGVLF